MHRDTLAVRLLRCTRKHYPFLLLLLLGPVTIFASSTSPLMSLGASNPLIAELQLHRPIPKTLTWSLAGPPRAGHLSASPVSPVLSPPPNQVQETLPLLTEESAVVEFPTGKHPGRPIQHQLAGRVCYTPPEVQHFEVLQVLLQYETVFRPKNGLFVQCLKPHFGFHCFGPLHC